MRIGSLEHRDLFCRWFVNTHMPYEPEQLPWPELDQDSLDLLRAIPIWSTALQVELNAGVMVNGFAATRSDSVIREAVALQGYEEERHARMIATLVDRYQLQATREEPKVTPTRRAFIDFGYNECLDSFFGFGIFRLAREARILPENLTSLFSRVLYEEARHIVFFVNWIAYDRAIRGYSSFKNTAATALGYVRALMKTIGRAKEAKPQSGVYNAPDMIKGLTFSAFLQACLLENDANMTNFDQDLLRPRVIPAIAQSVLNVIQAGGRIKEFARARATR
ncbi:MAG: ferritin-like domain-containing protein [Candidatus Eremiobacteraeota bacterium]|nr:ferritin-like domain-containing protein [Candidatus Eremiobacteraeota bacterium]